MDQTVCTGSTSTYLLVLLPMGWLAVRIAVQRPESDGRADPGDAILN